MNEYLLINMLSDINPALLEDDYMENDMKKKKSSLFKRFFSYFKSKKSKDFLKPFVITNTDEEYQEPVEVVILQTDNEDEYTVQDEIYKKDFSITVFKKRINKVYTIISGVVASTVFIIGILIFLIRKIRTIKQRSKIQISF